jgi:ABC-type methionine transport system permease subunit
MNIAEVKIKDKSTTITLNDKTFSTGSTGFFGMGKLDMDDGKTRYQIQVTVVLIGSKPKTA